MLLCLNRLWWNSPTDPWTILACKGRLHKVGIIFKDWVLQMAQWSWKGRKRRNAGQSPTLKRTIWSLMRMRKCGSNSSGPMVTTPVTTTALSTIRISLTRIASTRASSMATKPWTLMQRAMVSCKNGLLHQATTKTLSWAGISITLQVTPRTLLDLACFKMKNKRSFCQISAEEVLIYSLKWIITKAVNQARKLSLHKVK